MAITIKEFTEKETVPVGTHVARCIRVIDLGVQIGQFNGQPKAQHKVDIGFELPNCLMAGTYKPELKGKPFYISGRFTLSLHENSVLRPLLEGWRGRAFTKEEKKNFNIAALVGKPCMINCVESEDGRFVNISSASPLPKEIKCPAQINVGYEFSLEPGSFDVKVFSALSEYYQNLISNSPNYKALFNQPDEQGEAEPVPDQEGQEGDESVPF